ncbi:hypothetical protein HHK36_014719 [Tetracentron sinense]|uniref:Uncharacterized protein n=1 Tax=Tetracentron sinense TaxID=13715 RepID=A0A834Z1S5_TETSI|nr:hypothetical protein HHK36_014719 [Tetracentron sinense]
MDPPRSQSREHNGLMSWPEHFYKPRQHPQYPDRTDKKANSLSAKAMQLSIFGSMVNYKRRRTKSFPRSFQVTPLHSLSYPRVPSRGTYARPLVSARSEEAATTSKNVEAKEFAGQNPKPPLGSRTKVSRILDNSSDDESGDDDDDLIVRIDSPSGLSFRQAS